MAEDKIDFKKIEQKWQEKWEKEKVFVVKDNSKKKKYYVLEMFPYPSASGLHMGHALNYTIGDIFARFKRMSGFNVLYPMGFDALGLPAENAAIKANSHPKPFTENAIKNYTRQMKELGLSYDWSKTLATLNPDYYKWNQYFFLKFLENGLVYRKKASVNWCPECHTVLANEQVHNGKCWRHEDTDVEIKQLEQWFIKTTKYSDELLEKAEGLNWPDKIKKLQKNWIGKSYGTEIDFEISRFGDISKKEFVFLHAYGDSSQDSFWNWLKREVENRGGKVVFMPDLPNTNAPKIEEQLKFVNDNYVFKENTIVVGHSLGNILMMKILEKLKIKISGFVMVGAPLPRLIEEYKNGKAFKDLKPRPFLAGYCDWKFDYNKIKEKAHKIIVLEDENDHIVHRDDPKKLAELLNAEYILSIGNKTHYNGEKEEKVLDCIFKKWPIFTTRPDTIYGVTFMVVSAQHSRLFELVTDKQKKEVEKFLKKIKSVSEKEQEEMEKEGVFTGSYAINPVTKEKVPVYAGNFVLADYGSGMVMAVPAHDERDFQFAKKYGIAVKQVIAPMFNNTFEKDAVRLDKKIEERDSVFIIVKHWKEDKYFCLDWKEHKWKSFLMGGIEKGETPEQAAIRETKEETGYFDMKSVKQIGMEVHSKFYAGHKDVNRYGKYKMFVIELKSDKHKKINEEETKNHNGLWIDKNKILNFLNLENHKYAWEIYSNGERAYTDKGILINSSEFNGINNDDAKKKITEFLEKKKLGKAVVNYKFRDWLISRQRYWGTPIPIIYCDKCGAVPVPEKDLPVELPEKVKFGKGNPLETNSEWVSVKCPKCKSDARRETDTMDTFFDSSWYYLRYCDNKNDKKPFDSKKIDYWMPVDFYIGGAEHACMHLIYARFFTKALRDLGFLKFDEPFLKLFNQGMLHGSDGEKMSKSKGNVINPDEVSKKYGIDTARLFLVSVASPDKDIDWSEKGIEGSLRLINKIFYYFENLKTGKSSLKTESKINKAIKEITEDIENLRYNLAVIKLRQLFESFENEESISKKDAESFLKLLSVFCPHISEEIWNKIGNKDFISLSEWPKSDEKKINEKLEQEEKQLEKLAEDINNILKIVETKGEKVSKGYVYCVPPELANYKSGIEIIEKKTNIKIEVFAVNDKNKIDPENKSSRAKFGKPAIYLEQ